MHLIENLCCSEIWSHLVAADGSCLGVHSVCLCVLRYERHQARLKEELAKIAEREELTRAMTRERLSTRREAEKVKQLVRTQRLTSLKSSILILISPMFAAAIDLLAKSNALTFHLDRRDITMSPK